MSFTRVKPALPVQCVAASAIGFFTIRAGWLAELELENSISGGVAENQIAVARPDRPFGKNETRGHAVEVYVSKVLSSDGENKKEIQNGELHSLIRLAGRSRLGNARSVTEP